MERAIEVLELMRSEKIGHTFDSFICSSIFSGFCAIGKQELGLEFYEEVEKEMGLSRIQLLVPLLLMRCVKKVELMRLAIWFGQWRVKEWFWVRFCTVVGYVGT